MKFELHNVWKSKHLTILIFTYIISLQYKITIIIKLVEGEKYGYKNNNREQLIEFIEKYGNTVPSR